MSRVCLVTGAASGIGAALAQRLLAEGHRVMACDIQAEALARQFHAAPADRLETRVIDVRSAEQWADAVAAVTTRWGRLDVLANIAGVLRDGWVSETTAPDIDFHFDINVKGPILGVQAALPALQAAGGGHIVNLCSLSSLSPVPGLSLYSASKYAIRSWSLAAGMELADHNIKVTAICPDAVQTPMLDIQKGKPQAALTFSGRRALTVDEVVTAIVEVALVQGPLEIVLPVWRGITAKAANAAPNWSAGALGFFRKAGQRRQAKIAAGQDATRS